MTHIHLNELILRYPPLAVCENSIAAAFDLMRGSIGAGGKLLLCGNGGSAADCDHWAAELLKGFCRRRPLTTEQSAGLPPELAMWLQNAIPAIPLTGFPALATAFQNDVDAQLTFAQLVWGLGRPGDVLVAISTSGNSKNVLNAAHVARARGLKIVGLTAAGGGALAGLCDACIKAPAASTHHAQEFHLPIYHTLCLMLEDEFFSASEE